MEFQTFQNRVIFMDDQRPFQCHRARQMVLFEFDNILEKVVIIALYILYIHTVQIAILLEFQQHVQTPFEFRPWTIIAGHKKKRIKLIGITLFKISQCPRGAVNTGAQSKFFEKIGLARFNK